jgi:hypothetical protein
MIIESVQAGVKWKGGWSGWRLFLPKALSRRTSNGGDDGVTSERAQARSWH